MVLHISVLTKDTTACLSVSLVLLGSNMGLIIHNMESSFVFFVVKTDNLTCLNG